MVRESMICFCSCMYMSGCPFSWKWICHCHIHLSPSFSTPSHSSIRTNAYVHEMRWDMGHSPSLRNENWESEVHCYVMLHSHRFLKAKICVASEGAPKEHDWNLEEARACDPSASILLFWYGSFDQIHELSHRVRGNKRKEKKTENEILLSLY